MMEFLQQISWEMRAKVPTDQQPQGFAEKKKREKSISSHTGTHKPLRLFCAPARPAPARSRAFGKR